MTLNRTRLRQPDMLSQKKQINERPLSDGRPFPLYVSNRVRSRRPIKTLPGSANQCQLRPVDRGELDVADAADPPDLVAKLAVDGEIAAERELRPITVTQP